MLMKYWLRLQPRKKPRTSLLAQIANSLYRKSSCKSRKTRCRYRESYSNCRRQIGRNGSWAWISRSCHHGFRTTTSTNRNKSPQWAWEVMVPVALGGSRCNSGHYMTEFRCLCVVCYLYDWSSVVIQMFVCCMLPIWLNFRMCDEWTEVLLKLHHILLLDLLVKCTEAQHSV